MAKQEQTAIDKDMNNVVITLILSQLFSGRPLSLVHEQLQVHTPPYILSSPNHTKIYSLTVAV